MFGLVRVRFRLVFGLVRCLVWSVVQFGALFGLTRKKSADSIRLKNSSQVDFT